MARRSRFHFPGATYHVMLRGNNGKAIFTTDEERCRLCFLLQEGVERYGHQIYAYCFMTNHIHLAIKVNEVPISKILQNLAFRYTRYFNRKHQVIGHLFQGRFKSVLVDSAHYLKHLIRYIHLNPVRAGLVDNPMDYRWSSHRVYLFEEEITWLAQDEGLKEFGDTSRFQNFVIAGIGIEEDVDFKVGCGHGVLGEEEFVEKIRVAMDGPEKLNQKSIDSETLVSKICVNYQIDVTDLQKAGIDRRNSHIRSVIALLARDLEGVTFEELAKIFRRESSGLSKGAARLEIRMKKCDRIKKEVGDLKRSICRS